MKKTSGFTIVEMSFVLMILAIGIVAAVKGNSIMDTYRLHGTITDLQKYKASIVQFKQNYNYWPGDVPDATTIWTGVANMANGNGDGLIGTTVSSSTSEEFQAWYQVFIAGYAPFKANGLSGSIAVINFNPNNVASGEFNASIYRMYGGTDVNGSTGVKFNFLEAVAGGGTSYGNGLLKPSDAEILDKKMDDANASTGSVRGRSATTDYGGNTVDTNFTCLDSGVYRMTYGTQSNLIRGCIMRFLLVDNK